MCVGFCCFIRVSPTGGCKILNMTFSFSLKLRIGFFFLFFSLTLVYNIFIGLGHLVHLTYFFKFKTCKSKIPHKITDYGNLTDPNTHGIAAAQLGWWVLARKEGTLVVVGIWVDDHLHRCWSNECKPRWRPNNKCTALTHHSLARSLAST